jgi:hypothetical protein
MLGIPSRDGAALARMCTNIQLTGQLGATAVHDGRQRAAPWSVGFHATTHGWFLRIRRGGTLTMYPTDTDRLAQQWHDLITATRRIG